MNSLRNHFLYLVFAISSFAIANWTNSTIVENYLVNNLITIVIALLAINVQTIAVMTVKLREIANGSSFQSTIKEIKKSIYEQCVLVGASLLINGAFNMNHFEHRNLIIGISSFYVLYASLHIFIDTVDGLIIALFPEQ